MRAGIGSGTTATYPGGMPASSPSSGVRYRRMIFRTLGTTYPDAQCELRFKNPFELLVATILSAQCTDQRVNSVTPALFQRYPNPPRLAAADRDDLEALIKPTGFFRQKANTLVAMAQQVCENFGGAVPGTLEELTTLPGVGRKTANVVLGDAFGIPGITVDTHFARLSRRFGWTQETNPDRIEADVMALFPRKDWTLLSHRLIWHGRRRCHARKPACGACPVARWCPSFGDGPIDPVIAERLVKTEGPR